MTRPSRHVLLLGGSGSIGRATAAALLRAGHRVTALIRPGARPPSGCTVRLGSVTAAGAVAVALRDATAAAATAEGAAIDAVVSCLASRTGVPHDAWAVDHAANSAALAAARSAGVTQFVLVSAICVQKPRLAFQHAKLAFEAELQAADLVWTILRPTAFFKSLSGQVARVQAGRPFLVFGDGRLTACKPIADDDLGDVVARSLTDPALQRRVLPVGGPGPALTPRDQAAMLAGLLGRDVPVRQVPAALLGAIAGGLGALGLVSRRLAEKAELARIGRYYATESMLVWDAVAGRYDAAATPEYGTRTLRDHYAALLRGDVTDDRGAHAVF